MSERGTFSPFWHRVRAMRPRLRTHVQISRQHYRGERWYVVHDPSANGFYRLNPVSHEFVSLLDGQRTVEDVWRINLERHADEALTQQDVINVLAQLSSANLLQGDQAPEVEQLLRRGRDRTKKKVLGNAIGLMYFKVKLFNPDRLLTTLQPIFRPVLSKAGLVLWLALLIAALGTILPHMSELVAGVGSAIAPGNMGWMLAGYVLLKLWHELGHGLICKRFGGQVPEFGAMMLVLVPSPYVDASSAWAFQSKAKRMLVGAGGMIFELFAASLAAFVWSATRDTPGLAHQIAYNVMLTSGVSTLLFNANPLMRFDGYYILSDALEVPNLMQRSTKMLTFMAQRLIFGIERAQAPTSSPGEAGILLVYGITAMVYRVFVFAAITLYILGKFFALGVFLAVWTAAMWFILPVGKLVHWLSSAPDLHDRRPRAIGTVATLAGAALVGLGAIPLPDHRRTQGVIESTTRTGLFVPAESVIESVHVRAGQTVRTGEVIAQLANPELHAQLRLARAQLSEARAREAHATGTNIGAAQVAREYVAAFEAQEKILAEKVSRLRVVAPHDGLLVMPADAQSIEPSRRVGEFVREGELLCEVIDGGSLHVAAALSQSEADWISSLPSDRYRVEARTWSHVHDVSLLIPTSLPSAAGVELPHTSLTYGGGGVIEPAPGDETMQSSKTPLFRATFAQAPGASTALGYPGERVTLRFTLPARPLLAQWWRAIDQTLQGRARI